MTKKIALILLCVVGISNAQNFQGKAIYKTNKKSNITLGEDQSSKMTDDMKAQIQTRLQKMNQKTFTLEFDKSTSLYKEDVTLKTPSIASRGGVSAFSLGVNGITDTYYKNIKENRFVNQTEIQGKRFLVKDKLRDFDWKLTSQTKNIGNYTCYKATFSEEVVKITQVVEAEKLIKKEEKETKTTVAWYTLQIPVSNGPDKYQGLPGLILELNDGTTTMVCTEIILDKSKTITINEPKKGKEVSLSEYINIRKQKQKEMLEQFRSKRGVDLGNGTIIKIKN
ncbi:GLPGLI family protein [Polaribacter sp. WD7]|uniref:GLPGLI family protein n=1 Tax=Polaribacter sp. WD7 TaxID=2269061 RepID=UPI000DF1765E|nr:GLPGLI family protein [Polaribacter sp. WD7]RCS28262.1 GLPGLI family protein [Polaribacter sp. WD7]